MFPGPANYTGSRWGDYTMTTVDPSNGTDFWHVNEYSAGGTAWHTRIGKFNFGWWFSNAYAYLISNRYNDTNSHRNGDRDSDGCTKVYANTKASPDATAASVDSASLNALKTGHTY